ncbi:hypothetical protein [Lysinibacter sp. HNR]|uniref:hypothetical protein n=1 Tax=Lysinibacter sp. HNR TaxID=3031408 RepID=UPI002434F7DF|nr:hypothetical protein [Lysinibacter sp. HNR]WGD38496.1 hypothetical protein FrondiHNR_06185 [Lysinibacter sp. HNR]
MAERPVKAPEEIEQWASWIREKATKKPPEPGTIKTPDSIIQDLDELVYLAGQNVLILHEADWTRTTAKRELAKAEALASQGLTGTAAARAAAVLLATHEEREAAEIADIAYRYAKSCADLVESRKSAVQTQSKQVEVTYQLAGSRRA